MLKILQARLQQYVNHEIPDVQDGFRKGRGRNQRSNCQHLLAHRKSKRLPEKDLLCFIYTLKTFFQEKTWKILKRMGIHAP